MLLVTAANAESAKVVGAEVAETCLKKILKMLFLIEMVKFILVLLQLLLIQSEKMEFKFN